MNKTLFATLPLALSVAGLTASAQAQNNSDSSSQSWALEEVMVTAQRRSENSQDIPMAVSSLNAEALQKIGFSSLRDIADKIPALNIQPDYERASALKVYIRGVGQEKPANFERDNGVGIYLDDIYVGHGNGLAAEMNDVERIEVLAGPQGILYGRNTIGGAVKFISAKPTGEFGIKQELDVGNYDLIRSTTHLNLPTTANISSKLTLLKSHKDGWVKNSGRGGNPGDKEATGYRAALRWEPSDQWLVDYTFDKVDQDSVSGYQQHSYPMFATHLTAFKVYKDRQKKTWRPIDLDIRDDFKTEGHALTAQWLFADNMSLKSITGYREFSGDSLQDGAESFNVSTLVTNAVEQDQFSQEFLLSGENADGSIKYHTGLYYFKEQAKQQEAELVSNYDVADAINSALLAGEPIAPPALSDLRPENHYDIENKSRAIYAQVTWNPAAFDHRLTLDLGARYTEDERSLGWIKPINAGGPFPIENKDDFEADSFDPAFTVDWAWTDSIHTYFRYAQAYRSGGFDTGAERLQAFDSEELESFELGFKSKMLDNKLLFNVAVFDLDYKDIQIQFFDPGLAADEPPAKVTVNGAKASTQGIEFELQYMPTANLMLRAAGAYLESDSTVTNPFTGETGDRPLFNTPKLKYNLEADYTFADTRFGTVSGILSYDYRDEELGAGNTDEKDVKPDYALVNARLMLSQIPVAVGELDLALWSKNLLDEEYETYHAFGAVVYGEPRTVGISLTYQF
ncbi:TonB-dependent receptor [Parahaliea sp. F7430]|uniref:TonB-dependent receptor n=1 Tax=Sediminihaliea albiluteola TaxID=2758564 RepID=A0A7W2YJ16_9GAMM|nr:TonB-dependent receptor [Sediminihaliea albiluteola]MBA6411828.1 TonB-dependent receptor [Sediminihaliea albiluteola]